MRVLYYSRNNNVINAEQKRNRSATRLARSPVCADTADHGTSLNLTFKTDRPLVEETVSPSNRTRPVLAGAHTRRRGARTVDEL